MKKPNILVIMSDGIDIWNISAYHRGMMGADPRAEGRILDPTTATAIAASWAQ